MHPYVFVHKRPGNSSPLDDGSCPHCREAEATITKIKVYDAYDGFAIVAFAVAVFGTAVWMAMMIPVLFALFVGVGLCLAICLLVWTRAKIAFSFRMLRSRVVYDYETKDDERHTHFSPITVPTDAKIIIERTIGIRKSRTRALKLPDFPRWGESGIPWRVTSDRFGQYLEIEHGGTRVNDFAPRIFDLLAAQSRLGDLLLFKREWIEMAVELEVLRRVTTYEHPLNHGKSKHVARVHERLDRIVRRLDSGNIGLYQHRADELMRALEESGGRAKLTSPEPQRPALG